MFELVLTNVCLITEDATHHCSIGIADGTIARIAESGEALEGKAVIDCTGKLVMPGFIDLHVHFNEPGLTRREEYATGSAAAAVGGVTLFADMPLSNEPFTLTAADVLDKIDRASKRSLVDFAIWGGFVEDNVERMQPMLKAGAYGFKAFTCDAGDGFPTPKPDTMTRGFEKAAQLGTFIGVHCEDQKIIADITARCPADMDEIDRFLTIHSKDVELTATKKSIQYAEASGAHLHVCHASMPETVEMVAEARQRGVSVTVETCPQYLLYTTDDLHRIRGRLKCTPPVRTAEDVDGMWRLLADGQIDFIGTDHSPAEVSEKECAAFDDCWGGINGVQYLFPLLYTEGVLRRGIDPQLLVRLYSAAPARFIGQYPNKGTLKEGSEATFVIFDPEAEWTIQAEDLLTKHQQTPYEGLRCRGRIEQTWLRGQPICKYDPATDRHRILGSMGSGKLIKPLNNKGNN